MKISAIFLIVALAGVEASVAASTITSRVVERGRNHEVIESVRSAPNGTGLVTNRYTRIGNGLNYQAADGNWVQAKPVVQSFPGGILCTGATYSVILGRNLSASGVVDFEGSSGDRIVLSPLALLLHDPQSGKSITIATVTNSTAEILSGNRVIYRDAVQGVRASIVMNYERGRFSQDVVLEENIVLPSGFGPLTQLQIASEILSSPTPAVTAHVLREETNEVKRAAMAEPDQVDQTVVFGGVMMGPGGIGLPTDSNSAHIVPITKQVAHLPDNRTILLESLELNNPRVKQALEKLPVRTASAVGDKAEESFAEQLPPRRQGDETSFKDRLAAITGSGNVLVASAPLPVGEASGLPRGFVADYTMLDSWMDGWTFYGGQTYVVDGYCVADYPTFQAGGIFKSEYNANFTIADNVTWPNALPRVVFTSVDDDSIGDNIDGQQQTYPLTRMAQYGLALYYVPSMYLCYLDVRFAQTGVYCYGNSYSICNSYFLNCGTGVYAASSYISLYSSDICEVDTLSDHDYYGSVSAQYYLTDCTADRDSNGMPDWWEYKYFYNLGQNPNGDPDGDGFNNLTESQAGTNPLCYDTQPSVGYPYDQTCKGVIKQITLQGYDGCNERLTFSKVANPQHGSLGTITPNPNDPSQAFVTYTPNPGYCGQDSFTFKANNGLLDSFNIGTVTIDVGDPNPGALAHDVLSGVNTPVTITLSGSDFCDDLTSFDVTAFGEPDHGDLDQITQIDGTHATVTYTPDQDYEGKDYFLFNVSNCRATSQDAVVTVTVVPGPELSTECRLDRIILRWTVPDLPFYDFKIYRCESVGGSCTPTYYTTVPSSARMYVDTNLDPAKTYCYQVTFRVLVNAPTPFESPRSNSECNQPCSPPQQSGIDVAFIIDNTGSMPSVAQLTSGISAVLDDIEFASGTNYRLALVTPDQDQVNVRLAFSSNNRTPFETALNSNFQTTDSGSPESTDECLNTVLNSLAAANRTNPRQCDPRSSPLQYNNFSPGFRTDPDVLKLVVMITDHEPGGFCDSSDSGAQASYYASQAANNCIKINAIQVRLSDGTLDSVTQQVMLNYERTTCGWFSDVPHDGSGTAEAVGRMLYVAGYCDCP